MDRLKSLESKTWMEIEQDRNIRTHGEIEVGKLADAAQQRWRSLGLDQFDTAYKLRVAKRVRVWGYRTGETFHIVWLDTDHSVYPTDG